MRKKNEKKFWDMEIIGNRRKKKLWYWKKPGKGQSNETKSCSLNIGAVEPVEFFFLPSHSSLFFLKKVCMEPFKISLKLNYNNNETRTEYLRSMTAIK